MAALVAREAAGRPKGGLLRLELTAGAPGAGSGTAGVAGRGSSTSPPPLPPPLRPLWAPRRQMSP
eukprot:6252631-Prymnesium_polylepis.1